MGNSLTEVDAKGKIVPDLAESFEPGDDAKSWVFKLRKGATFHNGKNVTADDVIASFRHHMGKDSKSAAKSYVDAIADIKADGDFIGRDGGSSQIVIGDPRISKRHCWIGVKAGRVVIADQNSRNGTFVNDPKSARVTETSLNAGDVVILGESDVARFEYHH